MNPFLLSSSPNNLPFQTPSSSPTPADSTTSLGALASQHPCVQQLLHDYNALNARYMDTTMIFQDTVKQNRDLQAKLQETVQTMERQLGSGSLAALLKELTPFGKPAIRPAGLPASIIWTWDDMKKDPDYAPTLKNPSRPFMQYAIRNANGHMVDSSEYEAIKQATETIYKANLQSLTAHGGEVLGVLQLRSFHHDAWITAIRELEAAHPVVGLCAEHWKAEKLLGSHIRTLSSKLSRQSKRTEVKPVPSGPATTNNKTVPVSTSDPDISKRTAAEANMTDVIDPRLSGLPFPSATGKRPRIDGESRSANAGSDGLITDVFAIQSSSDNGLNASERPNPLGLQLSTSKINISHIDVPPSLDHLDSLFSTEFACVSNGTRLIQRLKMLQSTIVDTPSSENVLAFLSRIEAADPNDANLSEDDTNEGWGHHQYTSASMTITSVLTSWSDIGSITIACRFLAAAIKTRKVAAWICYHRKILNPKLLSDSYIDLTVDQFLKLTEDLGTMSSDKPSASSHESTSVPSGDLPSGNTPKQTGNSDDSLNNLKIDELKKWLASSSIVLPRTVKRKSDIVDFVRALEKPPTNGEIEAIIASRGK